MSSNPEGPLVIWDDLAGNFDYRKIEKFLDWTDESLAKRGLERHTETSADGRVSITTIRPKPQDVA